jgi:uncharacterized protein YcbK (DUF882 family)
MTIENRLRRRILLGAGMAMAGGLASPARAGLGRTDIRRLSLENLHTGERVKADYWIEGAYDADALRAIDRVLRDFRTGDVHPIAPRLLDVLSTLRGVLDTDSDVQVISAYRSPKTNAMLHEQNAGVAATSLHMQGMAIDIRIQGRPLLGLRDAALRLSAGGVGYYPKSNFLHLDIGRVRRW